MLRVILTVVWFLAAVFNCSAATNLALITHADAGKMFGFAVLALFFGILFIANFAMLKEGTNDPSHPYDPN